MNEDLQHCQEAIDKLMEHFDSVQIFANRHECGKENGTVNVSLGGGNWFARYGQVHEWITKVEEESRIHVRQ
jgi:hypothetical protein